MPISRSVTGNPGDDRVSTTSPKERSSLSLMVELDIEEAQVASNGSYDHSDVNHSDNSSPLRKATAANSDRDRELPSNQRLLGTAFFTFMTFALVQLCFSFVAGSKSMMGDSAAMIVDAISYLFNWAAERRKNRFDDLQDDSVDDVEADPVRAAHIRQRKKRKMILQLEILPPLFSVSTLVIVTIFIIKSAVDVLLHDVQLSKDEPNIYLMMGFSTFNLGLDFLNVLCFARAKHLTGYSTMAEDATVEENADGVCELAPSPAAEGHCEGGGIGNEHQGGSALMNQRKPGDQEVPMETIDGSIRADCCDDVAVEQSADYDLSDVANNSIHDGDLHNDHSKQRANLNMCSAYTHVFADTLRSIAVIFAAGLAMIFPDQIDPAVADATAALVVSSLILLSLMPLIQGLGRSIKKLRSILAEERAESL